MEKRIKKIIKGIGIGGAVGLGLYVSNEIRKEYNKTVAENNYLREFIDTHDLYKKEAESRITTASGTKEKSVKKHCWNGNCKSAGRCEHCNPNSPRKIFHVHVSSTD